MSPKRVLIVANQTAGGRHLVEEVQKRLDAGPAEFLLLAPATPPTSSLTWDERDVREGAQARLETACERLRKLGASVEGVVGDFHPMAAVHDVMLRHQFDEIIVSTLPQGISEWLGMDLPRRIARASGLPTTHVVSHE